MVSVLCRYCFAFLLWFACEFSYQDDQDLEAKRDAITAQRFMSVVEKNPQRGTALEKVFSHHLQLGTLDTLVSDLEKRAKDNPRDGVAWMLLGLFESQRRRDTQAIAAFAEAESLRPEDPLPAYYRGQCLLRTGEPTEAAEAFEKAIRRKPARVVLLEIFEQLGRTHQRQNRNDLAIDAWQRLEESFPNDLRVLEQIATIQNQEGAYQAALPRYERLVASTKDLFQKTQFRVEAAELRIKLGESERGRLDLQSVLGELNPESWLYRDVQRKIEDAFLRSDDLPGLISYYENRIAKMPDDIESMVRLSKFLTTTGRVAEANQWMVKAISRAPSRLDLRQAYIAQLIADQQIAAAIDEYSELSKLDPKNRDTLREWGKLILRDSLRTVDNARREASAVWNRIIENHPDDALEHVQIAELHQLAEMPDQALKHLERAVELQPEDSQYREFLGDFFFRQNQRERAFEVWDRIAEGPRRNAESVMRLAEIYDHAAQPDKAAGLAGEACKLADTNGAMWLRAARLQNKAEQTDDALNSLSKAETLADSDDQRQFIVDERINILEASNRLKATTASLQAQLQREQNPSIEQTQLLAQYLVRQRRWKEANVVVHRALASNETSLPMLRLSAEIAGGLGNMNQAIEAFRKLADSERRKRPEYLERIARIQVRQKKWTEAIETAKEVIAAVPSKIESYEFMAQICVQAKNYSLAIATLRKAIRIDPQSTSLTTALATALVDHLDFGEAIELYWQAFTKAPQLEDKLNLVSKLVVVYGKKFRATPTLDRKGDPISELIERLDSARKDPAARRDLTICMAQVYQSASNFEKAQRILEELVSNRTRDILVVQQLAKLSVDTGDIDMAIDYQRQLVALAPGQENESYLATLLRQRGDWNEANEIVVRLIQNEPDPSTAVKNLDALIQRGEYELVLQTLDPLLRNQPDQWELLFRLGLAHAGIDQWTQSRSAFEKILSLDLDRTVTGIRRRNANKKLGPTKPSSQIPSATTKPTSAEEEWLNCLDLPELSDIAQGRGRIATEASQGTGQKWSPENFGEMRLASIAWLLHCDAKDPKTKSEWIRRTLEKGDSDGNHSDLLDAFAVVKLKQDIDAMVQVSASLARSAEPAMQAIFSDSVRRRQVSGVALENRIHRPLTAQQLDLLVESFQSVQEELTAGVSVVPAVSQSATFLNSVRSSQLASMATQTGARPTAERLRILQIYNRSLLLSALPTASSTSSIRGDGLFRVVVNELQFAGRKEQAEAWIATQCDTANNEAQLSQVCEFLLSSQRFNAIEGPLLRWFDLQLQQLKDTSNLSTSTSPVGVAASSFSWNAPTDFSIRWIEKWGEKVPLESAIRILDSAMRIANQNFRSDNLPPLDSWSIFGNPRLPTQSTNSTQNWCVHLISQQDQRLLQSIHQALNSANRGDEWLTYLKKRVEREDGLLKDVEQLRRFLVVEQSVSQENDPFNVEDALLSISEKPGFQLRAAATLIAKQDFRLAMKVASSASASTPQESLIRALILVHGSSALNDKALLESSLQELKVLNLDAATRQSLSGVLQKASYMGVSGATGMMTSPPSTASRASVAKVAPKSVPSQETIRNIEMTKFATNGNEAEAIKIAKQILSKPRTFPTTIPINLIPTIRNSNPQGGTPVGSTQSTNRVTGGSGFGGAYSGGSSSASVALPGSLAARADASTAARRSALAILKRYGELEKMIAETEQRIANGADSFFLLEQLAEYQEFAGNSNAAIEAMTRALQIRPNAIPLRIHLAGLLSQIDEEKACDQYSELIRRDPNSALALMAGITGLFVSCNRLTDLLEAIRNANFYLVPKRNEVLLNILTQIGAEVNFEVNAVISEKLVATDPSLRQTALQFLYGAAKTNYPRILDFTLDAIIPSEFESVNDPWHGLSEASLYSTTELTTLFEEILRSHPKEVVLEKLESNIRSAVERMPGWYGGQVMLALICASTERVDEAKERYAELASLTRLHVGCPEAVAWKLAKEFAQIHQSSAAVRLLETLVGSKSFASLSAEQSPVIMLSKLWIEEGQREKAIAAINKELFNGNLAMLTRRVTSSTTMVPTSTSRAGVPSVSYQTVTSGTSDQQPFAVAEQLLSLGLPVEAYRFFELQKGFDQLLASGAPIQQETHFSEEGEAGKKAAIAILPSIPLDQIDAELLRDRAIPALNLPTLELMFRIPLASQATSQQIESELQSILIRSAKAGKLTDIEKRLKKLADLHPNDVTIHATTARIRLATGEGDAKSALNEIERVMFYLNPQSSHTDSTIALSLWLVARECYQAGKHFDVAERLAEVALKAAIHLDGLKAVVRVSRIPQPLRQQLNPGMGIAVSPGPQGQQFNSGNRLESKQMLPESQRANLILLEWGSSLLQQGMTKQGNSKLEELRKRIEITGPMHDRYESNIALASKAVAGGQLALAKKIAKNLATVENTPDQSRILLRLVQKMIDHCADDRERYEFLVSIVFPMREAISLHAENVDLLTSPPSNLGEKLVAVASKLDRLEELKSLLDPLAFSIDGEVLKTQVAIAEKEFETAKTLLGRLFNDYQKSKSTQVLNSICQVAIPAFRVQELRRASMPILNELLQRNREREHLSKEDFAKLPLVIEIDEYLRSRNKE